MPIKYHQHICIRRLLALDDAQLQTLTDSPKKAAAIREGLSAMHNRQIRFLVPEECGNIRPDGSCGGHKIELHT